ncbi:MAG: phosphatase PAP2 family protein [Epsilonproteobacteria bacterium]|nr:phosphatase PAP2 family protein [Campylobacterota bacterium]
MFGLGKYFWIFTSISLLIFLGFPQIDLWIAAYFYDEGFYLKNHPFILLLFKYSPIFAALVGLLALFCLLLSYIRKHNHYMKRIGWLYLLAVLIIGPILIVNVLFKDNWGRARPKQIEQFGGKKEFTPAFVLTNQCKKNCSFSCGHASAGFFFIAIALLSRRNKALYTAAAIALGFTIGLGRMAQGGHFFSDVVFSFIFLYMTAKILYYIMIKQEADNVRIKRVKP